VTILSYEEFFQAEHVRLARALYLLTGSAAEADELT
jgi:DNA-directed RNA polymerase specialized sigma24 family protein